VCFFKDFIYSFDRERASERAQEGERQAEGAGSQLSKEHNAGLDPRTPGIMNEGSHSTS